MKPKFKIGDVIRYSFSDYSQYNFFGSEGIIISVEISPTIKYNIKWFDSYKSYGLKGIHRFSENTLTLVKSSDGYLVCKKIK